MNRAPYLLLRELLERPELLLPPQAVIPKLAWEGRVSLLAAEEKSGKSTLAGQAAACLAQGTSFLGEIVLARPVLWLALDEPLGDLVRRLRRFGADDDVAVLTYRPLPTELLDMVLELNAGLVVIDTLSEFVDGLVGDQNAAEQWTAHLRQLRTVAQTAGAAVLLLHHANRGSGGYRGSSQIGAGVDAILEMTPGQGNSAVRVVRSRGRISVESFRLRYEEKQGYHLEAGNLPLELQILQAISADPGISKRRLRDQVSGGNTAKDAILDELLRRGAVENRGDRKACSYFVPGHGGARPGHGSGHIHFGQAAADTGEDKGHGEWGDGKSFRATTRRSLGTVVGTPRAQPPLEGGLGHTLKGEHVGYGSDAQENGASPTFCNDEGAA